jgi:hypothetical protein
VVDAYGDYAIYQTRTERVIPVVLIYPSPNQPEIRIVP